MDEQVKILIRHLDRLSSARARRLAAVWAAAFAGGLAALLLAYHLADLIFILHPFGRLFLRAVFLAAALAGIWGALFFVLWRRSPAATAAWLEGRRPEFRQELSTVIQCSGRQEYSGQLVSALAEKAVHKLEKSAPSPEPPRTRVRTWIISATLWAVVAVSGLVWPGPAITSLARLADPWREIGDWSKIKVMPGDSRIPAGEELQISIPARSDKAFVVFEGNVGRRSIHPFNQTTGGLKAKLPPAAGDFQYRVFLGRMQSRSFQVAVFHPVVLEDIGVRIAPPAYTGLKAMELPNQGSIEAVKGSRAWISARPSRPLGSAQAIFTGGRIEPGVIVQGSIVFSFYVRKDESYRLMAVSPSGNDTFLSAEYPITAVPDLPPQAELFGDESPNMLDEEMTAMVEGRASDDFGLSRLGIGYLLHGQETFREAASWRGTVTDTSMRFEWSLANLGLLPGDSLVYWLEATDNDAVSGPKTGRSRSRKLWMPSLAEMYQAMAGRDSAAQAELAGLQPEQTELREQIQRLSQAIKESRRIEWRQQAAMEKALADQEELLDRLERAADQALESMRPEGRRVEIDAETASKLRELHQLFDQVATDEMRRAMEKLSQALEKMDRQQVAQALENMNLTAEQLKKRLDQAIAALKELQQQRQLDRIRQDLDRLLKEQSDIRDRAGKTGDPQEADRLARRQKQAADDLEALALKVSQLGEQMASQPEAGEKLRQSSQQLQRKGTPAKMRQAGQRLAQGDPPGARNLQQQALQEMTELSQGLQSARSSMAQAGSRARSQALRQKAREVLTLSQQQEDLNRSMRGGGNPQDLAERQQSLARAGAKLQSQAGGQQGIMMPPQAAGSLSRALQAMSRCSRDLMGGRQGQSPQSGQEAVAALNQAAAALMEASSRSSGSSGGGDIMQELEGLSGQQSEINQQTLGLMPSPGGQSEALSQEVRSQMARLAAEQEAVRQGLEEFNRKYADRADRTGRLDDLASEMQKAAEDLRRQQVDDRTRERQQRILNRLLQAQRSLRDQDFSQQRKAEPGRDQGRTAAGQVMKPGQIPPPPSDREWRKEPCPIEYQEIIERYFRSLGW
jgi:hypothetical protein